MIPEETVQAVVAASDIVAVVSSYMPLKRAGRDYKGLCPFHGEKTASFTVSPAKGVFHCFGCKKGGGAIRFVMEMDQISFSDAVRKLGERFGVPVLEVEEDAASKAETRLRKQLLALHADIADWFHGILLKHPAAQIARDYWKSRGLNGDNAKHWKIGYAPPTAQAVLDWASKRKLSHELLVNAGMILFGDENGGYRRQPWFRFAGRLMFPICNEQGEVIGFSGRVLEADAKAAKYMNSPEMPIFDKGRTFFGLDKSKRAIHKLQKAVVCEGQMDLISCYERGIENIVAPLGTAFTEHHARVLKRMEAEVILCYDSDTAGLKAADRSFRELSQHGVYVRMAQLPTGDDPDSLIRREGPDSLRTRLEEAKAFIDFKIDALSAVTHFENTREKLKAAAEIAASIASISGKVAQEDALLTAATRFAVPPEELRRMIARAVRDQAREAARAAAAPNRQLRPDDAAEAKAETESFLAAALQEPYRNAFRLLCYLVTQDQESRRWINQQHRDEIEQVLPQADLLWQLIRCEDDLTQPGNLDSYLAQQETEAATTLTSILAGQVSNRASHAPGLGLATTQAAWLALRLVAKRQQASQLQAQLQRPNIQPLESMSLLQARNVLAKEILLLEAEKRQADTYLDHMKRLETKSDAS